MPAPPPEFWRETPAGVWLLMCGLATVAVVVPLLLAKGLLWTVERAARARRAGAGPAAFAFGPREKILWTAIAALLVALRWPLNGRSSAARLMREALEGLGVNLTGVMAALLAGWIAFLLRARYLQVLGERGRGR